MARAQVVVSDACGTLFDVLSAVLRLKDVTADAADVSVQPRARLHEDPWLGSLIGRLEARSV